MTRHPGSAALILAAHATDALAEIVRQCDLGMTRPTRDVLLDVRLLATTALSAEEDPCSTKHP